MLVQVTTDNHVSGGEKLNAYVESALSDALERYGDQVTRVGVHLADENSHKKGDADKRCTLEARLKGLEPIVATGSGADIDQAIDQSIEKLLAALEKKVGRLGDKKGRVPYNGE
jgi:ribosomal subunit interface protein